MAIEMQQIRHFAAVVKVGNLHRAAQALNITQPALTRSIKNLEHTLNAELLTRTSKGVRLTIFGEIVYDYAQRVLNDTEHLVDQIAQVRGAAPREIRIGIGSNFTDNALAAALGYVIDSQPQWRLTVVEDFFANLVARVSTGAIDAAITLYPEGFREPGLVVEHLASIHARFICSTSHPLVRKRSVALKDLLQSAWVMPGLEEADRFLERTFAHHALPPPQVRLRTSSLLLLKQVLAAGKFIALVPSYLVTDEFEGRNFAELRTEIGDVIAKAGVIYQSRATLSPAFNEFLKQLNWSFRRRGEGA